MAAREGVLSLRLYVAGDSPDSLLAIANLDALFPKGRRAPVQIEVVDVESQPARAARDGVMVTPTLLKVSPLPCCRVLGNLTNAGALLQLLGVKPARSLAGG